MTAQPTTPPAAESALTAHTPFPWELYPYTAEKSGLWYITDGRGNIIADNLTKYNADRLFTNAHAHAHAAQQRIGELEKAQCDFAAAVDACFVALAHAAKMETVSCGMRLEDARNRADEAKQNVEEYLNEIIPNR